MGDAVVGPDLSQMSAGLDAVNGIQGGVAVGPPVVASGVSSGGSWLSSVADFVKSAGQGIAGVVAAGGQAAQVVQSAVGKAQNDAAQAAAQSFFEKHKMEIMIATGMLVVYVTLRR